MNTQSRQLLNFLKKQNQMLKDYINELKQILKLNKEALQVTINYKNNQDYQNSIPKLINLLYDENLKLHARIQDLKLQIQSGMCKALISEQIAFASTQQEILLTNELKDKLVKLRKELENSERKIVDLTSLKIDQKLPLSSQSLELVRLIEYSDMTKVSKKMKDHLEKLTQELDQKKEQIERLRDGKQQLFKLNLILTKQLNELKLLTSCQTTKSNNQISLLEISNQDMTKYIKYQKRLLSNQNQNIYEESPNDLDSDIVGTDSNPDDITDQDEYNDDENQNNEGDDHHLNQVKHQDHFKINQSMQMPIMKFNSSADGSFGKNPKMNMTLNLGNLSLKKNIETKNQQTKPKMMVPKLQLTKAKQIQNLIVKKINNDQKKKKQSSSNIPIKEQKYKKLQEQLQNVRKKLGNEILSRLAMERQCNFMKRIISELQQRNLLLVDNRVKQQQQDSYQKKKKNNQTDNTETLLDICRDVTMNHRLRRILMGKEELLRKTAVESCQV